MLTMQQRKNKRGLQQLSDSQKMEAITKVQKGETKAAVAREFGVPESTLRGWCKKAKLNGHCQSSMNKSLQVGSTVSPVTMTPEMAYRDCNYSKGSGSDEGSATYPFSDEQEDEEVKPSPIVIPEERSRVLDWLNYGHYTQLVAVAVAAAQTTTTTSSSTTTESKTAQPVVTSSTCDDVVKPNAPSKLPHKKSNRITNSNIKNVGFYNWCKTNPTCEGYSSPVSPVSPASSDKNDSYEDEPLALIVPSKRRYGDIDASFKGELNKMLHDGHTIISNNHTLNNNIDISNKNNITSIKFINEDSTNVYDEHNYNGHLNNNYKKPTLSVEEALKHGELFLDWLKECSHPTVTVLQAKQIGTLLKNLRSSLERNQNRR